MSLDLSGKKFVVLGVANDKSIAWSIARNLCEAGASVALSYAGENLKRRVVPLSEKLAEISSNILTFQCDVTSDEDIDSMVSTVKEAWGSIDGIVHSVAFATRGDMEGRFSDTTRDGFHTAMDISVYSLVKVAGAFREITNPGSSIVTMTYLGSQRVVANYKVMGVAKAALEASVKYLAYDLGSDKGIRVNAISAGPLRTLAAAGIPEFKKMLSHFEDSAPLKRRVDVDEVGKTALFLLSNLSSGITGEVTYVDCGYNTVSV